MKCLKKVALLLTLVMLSSGMSGLAAWDGYENSAAGGTASVVNMNSLATISASGLSPSQSVRGGARYTAHWGDTKGKTMVKFNTVPRDWSSYEDLQLNIYSKEATGAQFMVLIYCDWVPNQGTKSSYHYTALTVDWTGWKTFTLNLENDLSHYNDADWSKVQYMAFSSSGWNCTPDPKTDLYFDSVTATLKDSSEVGEAAEEEASARYTKKQEQNFRDTIKDGKALYRFFGNIYTDGEAVSIDPEDYRAVTTVVGGVDMMPHKVLTDYLGAEMTAENGAYVFSANGKKLEVTPGESACKIDGQAATLDSAPYTEGETLYLPIRSCADALGISCGIYDQLVVFAKPEILAKFADDPDLSGLGGYMVAKKELDVDSVTAEDFANVKANWRRYLCGDGNNDLSDPLIVKKIQIVNNSGQSAWASMNKAADAEVLFGNVKVTTTGEMTKQYNRLAAMAIAYGTYGTELYHNPKLKSDIMYGMNWLYENLYGPAEMEGRGWKKMGSYDWWDWYVGSMIPLTQTLMILEPELTQSTIDKYLAPFDYLRTFVRTEKTVANGNSRLYVVTAAAILEEDAELMKECMADFDLTLREMQSGNGTRDDWSYITHDVYNLTGMYGVAVQIERVMLVASILAGTKFEINSVGKYRQALLMYNTFAPTIYDGYMVGGVQGRDPDQGQQYGKGFIGGAINLLGSFSVDDDLRLKQMIRTYVDEDNVANYLGYLNIDQITKLEKVLQDDTIPAAEPREEAHMLYNSDRVIWHRNGYSAVLAMSSERIGLYESINGKNQKGWYTGDGMLYIYNGTDQNDPYGKSYWNNVNLYHVPGTTEDTQERRVMSYAKPYMTPRDFVGGALLDDEYVTVAMDFEAYHHDKEPTFKDSGAGEDFDIHNNDLTAKKAYFFFDEEVVALGADINSTTGFDVQTTVENRALKKSEKPADTGESVGAIPYEVVGVTAAGDDGNVPENVLDNNYETRWSFESSNNGCLTLDLGEVKPVGYVGISQYSGSRVNAVFKLELSADGENWTQVFDGQSGGTTDMLEAYDCKGIAARYVRYVGAGRLTSHWNSITEFHVYAPQADGSLLLPGSGDDTTVYGTEDVTVDGVLLEKEKVIDKQYDGVKWAALEGAGGYYFPQGGSLSVKKENNSEAFLEMWLNHGANPQGATYAYVLLPNKTADETAAYAANADIEVLSNTEKVQAVRDKSTGTTGIVFWEAGSFGGITVTAPMIVMIRETGDSYEIAVSDPTQKLGSKEEEVTETITVDKRLTLQSADRNVTVNTAEEKAVLNVNFGKSGKTYTAEFSK